MHVLFHGWATECNIVVCVCTCMLGRSILTQAEGIQSVKCVIQTFTRCFWRELALLRPRVRLVTLSEESLGMNVLAVSVFI